MLGENGRRGLPEATRPPAASPYNAKDPKTIPSSHQTKTPPNINLAGSFSIIVALFCCLSGECVVPYAITSIWDWDADPPPEGGGGTCCTVSIRFIAAWALASKPFLTTLTDVAWCVRTWLIAMPDSIIKLAEPLIPSIDISLGLMLLAIVYLSAITPRNLNGRKVTPA